MSPTRFESGLVGAAASDRERAARMKLAPGREGFRCGRFTADCLQPRMLRADRARHRFDQRARIGMAWTLQQRTGWTGLHDPPRVHDADRRADFAAHAEIVADQQDRHAEFRVQAPADVENLRLDGNVQRSRRLVGDQQLRGGDQRRRDGGALAHSARELVRIAPHRLVHIRHAHATQALAHQFACLPPARLAVQQQWLGDLRPDPHDRVQRRQRILEDHADVLAAQLRQSPAARADQLLSVELHRASGHPCAGREQAVDGVHRHALARPGFPEQSEDLARTHLQRHAAYRPEAAGGPIRPPPANP